MRRWLNRQRSLADVALASLGRRRTRTMALLVVYALVVSVVAAVMLYAQAVRREAGRVLAQSPAVIVQRLQAGRFALVPDTYAEALRAIRGVQSVEGRLWGYYYDPVLKVAVTVMVAPEGSAHVVQDGHARVGPAVARAKGLSAGGQLLLITTARDVLRLTVDELLPDESAVLTADLILISAADFRALFDHPAGFYTDIALSVANPAEHRRVAEKVTTRMPDTRAIVRDDIARTYAATFSWREGLVLVAFIGVLAAFALFAFDRASGLSADETREIAVLKAVGWDAGDVMAMKAWEGALVSAVAFAAGYLAAYLFVFYVPAGPFDGALRGWTVVRPRIRLTPDTDAFQVATLFVLSVVPYTAAILVPVWRAAVAEPDVVMRG
ncbi:MAG: ABC transporter permease [Acidobacteria bacterium]|jgi:ABC-type lipoprotein release transport system permease subunit|nr:ABC transporter permease [Acidobacteriota bacterium]